MRFILLVAAMLAVSGPVLAGSGNIEALSKNETRMLAKMARQMQANLRRQHARQKQDALFEKPTVDFDEASRTITVTQRLLRHVDGGTRERIRASVEAQKPNLCLALRPRAVRRTALAIEVRALRDDGNSIAATRASPDDC